MNPIVSRWLKRVIFGGVAATAALTALVYGTDYCIFRVRVSTNRQPFASMTVLTYYAVPQKSGKTEFIFNPPGPQTCVNALFPHAGYVPCWYLKRHTEQRIDM